MEPVIGASGLAIKPRRAPQERAPRARSPLLTSASTHQDWARRLPDRGGGPRLPRQLQQVLPGAASGPRRRARACIAFIWLAVRRRSGACRLSERTRRPAGLAAGATVLGPSSGARIRRFRMRALSGTDRSGTTAGAGSARSAGSAARTRRERRGRGDRPGVFPRSTTAACGDGRSRPGERRRRPPAGGCDAGRSIECTAASAWSARTHRAPGRAVGAPATVCRCTHISRRGSPATVISVVASPPERACAACNTRLA